MPRNRQYANDADRQKAYRERLAALGPGRPVPPASPVKRKRHLSRPARLEQLRKDVQTLAAEYEDWLNALPEPLQESAISEKLAETVEQLNEAADLLNAVEPPKGFGRD
jgi:hypothetical protein